MKFDSSQLQSRLIDNSDKLPTAHHVFWGGVTGVFWLLYLYLWLPLITLAMWLLGVNNTLVELYIPEGRVDAYLLVALPLIALVCAVVLSTWAEYNRQRFKGTDRRKAVESVDIEMLALGLGVSSAVAAAMRAGKHMTLTMSDAAIPTAVSEHAPGPVGNGSIPGKQNAAMMAPVVIHPS